MAGVAITLVYRHQQSSTPIVASPAMVDFGTISQGKNSKAFVRLTNNSGSPLVLNKAETSCRCTTANVPDSIPAHQTVTIEVQLAGAETYGEARQAVTIAAAGFEDRPLVIPVLATFAGRRSGSATDDGNGCTLSSPRPRASAPSPSVQ